MSSKTFTLEKEVSGSWNEKKEILSEWSAEVSTSLEALRNERTKIARHMNHLTSRIKFIEESFHAGHSTEECLEKLRNLKSDLSALDQEILSKEELLRHINT